MPSPYVRGARKEGRPLSEDRAYAEELGLTLDIIRRHGGAARLKRLAPECRGLLLKSSGLTGKGWSLAKLGMNVKKPYAVQKEEAFELYCQALLRERGLR